MKTRIRSIGEILKGVKKMNKKSILAILLVFCFVFGVMAVSAYGLKLAPGKIGLMGKGKIVKADEAEDGMFPQYSAGSSILENGNISIISGKGNKIGQKNPAPGHIKTPAGKPALFGAIEIWVYPMSTTEVTTFSTIYGTYEGYNDSVNVQWAVDNVAAGGKVKLMTGQGGAYKAFYFGEPAVGADGVELHQQVYVEGEKLSTVSGATWNPAGSYNVDFMLPNGSTVKSDRAVVYGGYAPFFVNRAATFPYSFKSLRMERTGFCPFFLLGGGSTTVAKTVSDNIITNVLPFVTPITTTPISWGILIGPANKGEVYAENNYLNSNNDPNTDNTAGIKIDQLSVSEPTYSLKTYIRNNTIKVGDNATQVRYITPPATSSPSWETWIENNNIDAEYGLLFARGGKVHVTDNNIALRNNFPRDAQGVSLTRARISSEVKNNTIVGNNSLFGIGFNNTNSSEVFVGDGTLGSGVGKITGSFPPPPPGSPIFGPIVLFFSIGNTVKLDGSGLTVLELPTSEANTIIP